MIIISCLALCKGDPKPLLQKGFLNEDLEGIEKFIGDCLRERLHVPGKYSISRTIETIIAGIDLGEDCEDRLRQFSSASVSHSGCKAGNPWYFNVKAFVNNRFVFGKKEEMFDDHELLFYFYLV